MTRFILPLVIAVVFLGKVAAQTPDLKLVQGNVQEALAQAAQQQKILFVVGYSRLMPDAELENSDAGSRSRLYAYLNEHLLNYKLEMTQGEGAEFAKKYHGYPARTYFFLSGNDNLIDYTAADLQATDLLAFAKGVIEGGRETQPALRSKFDQGNRDLDLLCRLWKAEDERHLATLKVLEAFQATVKGADLLKRSNWEMFSGDGYLNTVFPSLFWKIESEPVQYLLANTEKFNGLYGADVVEKMIADIFLMQIYGCTQIVGDGSRECYESVLKKAEPVNNKTLQSALDSIRIERALSYQDWAKYCDGVDKLRSRNKVDNDELNDYASELLYAKADAVYLKRALGWSDDCVKAEPKYWYLHTNAMLWHAIGKDKKARSVGEKAVKVAKETGESPAPTREEMQQWK